MSDMMRNGVETGRERDRGELESLFCLGGSLLGVRVYVYVMGYRYGREW